MSNTHTGRIRARRAASTRRASTPPDVDQSWATEQLARTERLRASIRRLAAEHGLNLAELARRTGYRNANRFYNLLNGRSHSLSARTLMRLCDTFGLALDVLIGRQPDEALPGGPAAQTAGVWHAQEIAAALNEAQRALQTAREALDAAAHALRSATALLPSPRSAG